MPANLEIIRNWTKEQYLQVMSDAHKEVYGYRATGYVPYCEWDLSSLRKEFIRLCAMMDEQERYYDEE